jgi:hypothetical protein
MWAVDGLSDNSVVEESEDGHASRVLIPPTVFAVGFNNQFIIAKRHPKRGAQVDHASTEFYVVSVLDGQVHGPVDREKFLALRATLGVPASLDFSRVVQQLAASRLTSNHDEHNGTQNCSGYEEGARHCRRGKHQSHRQQTEHYCHES